jgi:uncharacterized membrane protein
MNNSTHSKWLIEVISALFILLFLYTSLNKIYDHKLFQFVLSKSPLVRDSASLVSYFIPIVEILVSIFLLIPRTRIIGLWSSLVLMSVFTAYIAYMIVSTPKLPCSCGGVLKQLSWNEHLLFNLCFVAFATTALYLTNPKMIVYTNRRSRKPA